MNIVYRPIEVWPGEPTKNRQYSPFSTEKTVTTSFGGYKTRERGATWSRAIEVVEKEARHIAKTGSLVVVQLFLTEREIRRDGKPRADARPSQPGVIVNIESKNGPLSFPCDTFRNWIDNLYAIGMALEALRKVDRYGVTKRGEQYTGWRALPGAGGSTATMTAEAAALFVANWSGQDADELLRHADIARAGYKLAAKKLHPDVGGDTHAFQQLQTAKTVLEKHHGAS